MENLIWHDGYLTKWGISKEAYFQKFDMMFGQPGTINAWISHTHKGYRLNLGQSYNSITDALAKNEGPFDTYQTPERILDVLKEHGFLHVDQMQDDYFHSAETFEKCRQLGASEEWLNAVDSWRDYVLNG